jgi:hypothetical protein
MLKDILIDGNGGLIGAVVRLGLPVTLSLIFAIFLLWRVDGSLTALQAAAADQHMDMVAASEKMSGFATEDKAERRVIRNLFLQVCLNTSKSDEDRRECVRKAE